MKQRNRVKKLQLFLYNTGRMHPGFGWNITKQGYPGEYYNKHTNVNGFVQKCCHTKTHVHCNVCNSYGTVYVGRSESEPNGYADCPHCKGSMWSKKGYRLV